MSEAVIVGGGLAGGTAAVLLAREGRRVRLLERDAEPRHKMCGEFLSIEARRDLTRAGLDTARLGAIPIDRMRLLAGRRAIEAELPFVAHGISRKVLDEALLELAARSGALIERGVRVSGVEGHQIPTSAGPCSADRILLATGKHDLRGARRAEPASRGGYVGFKMHWRVSPADQDHAIDLVLFDGGYAGLQPVAADRLNLCLIVRRERLAAAGGRWEGLLAELMREPGIARRIGEAEPLFAQPLTIANLPYGYVCKPDPAAPAHLYRLGDQAAMTASLTGDGMALAVRSAHVVASALLAGQSAQAYHARISAMVSRQVQRAMWLQRATELPLVQQAGFQVLKLWPKLLAALATATRLPDYSLSSPICAPPAKSCSSAVAARIASRE